MARYRLLDQLGCEIERVVHDGDFAVLPRHCGELNRLQAEAEAADNALSTLVWQRPELLNTPVLKEWHGLMLTIHDRNQRLLPHLAGIMAVQRDELRTLQQGASVLQRYRPHSTQTGGRISSSG